MSRTPKFSNIQYKLRRTAKSIPSAADIAYRILYGFQTVLSVIPADKGAAERPAPEYFSQQFFRMVRIFMPFSLRYSMASMLFFTMKMPSPPIWRSSADSVVSGSAFSSGL